MGHVDHGKTTLLDKIRKTQFAAREVGGISQHLTASQVSYQGKFITFIDTPGHEAFAAMRAHGGQAADLALLVVSAVEGVKPQTREALNHIRDGKLPLIVVLTKTDLPEADARRVKEELTKEGVLLEGFGGDIVCLEVSGVTGAGIEALLEMILLMAEMLELKADINAPFLGVIIESKLDPKKGPVALTVVRQGQLKIGQDILAGTVLGKVKSLVGSAGERRLVVGPGDSVEILGFHHVPGVGETISVSSERGADKAPSAVMLPVPAGNLVSAGHVISLIIRADSTGMVEAIREGLERFNKDKRRLNILYAGSGEVTSSDVLLAKADQALIIAFAVRAPEKILDLVKESKVLILEFEIIYKLMEKIEALILEQKAAENSLLKGQCEVLKIFTLASGDRVFGSKVLVGKIKVGDTVKVLRDEKLLASVKVKSLRVKTAKVSFVAAPTECGILLKTKEAVSVRDVFEVT